VLLRGGQVIIALQPVLYLVDGLPLLVVSTGVAAHLAYLSMLQTFPYATFLSAKFIGCVGALIVCTRTRTHTHSLTHSLTHSHTHTHTHTHTCIVLIRPILVRQCCSLRITF
jgi:hypothetical protein